jgi:hypothetical protein
MLETVTSTAPNWRGAVPASVRPVDRWAQSWSALGLETVSPWGILAPGHLGDQTVMKPLLEDAAVLGAILDAYPAPSLIVDDDVRALFINRAARLALGLDGDQLERAMLTRGGHLLHCVHAKETPEGCGRAPACHTCVIRNSVNKAFATEAVYGARTRLQLETPGGVAEAHFRVSAAPVTHGDFTATILTLENISDIVKLTSLLPICFHCRRVKNEQDYWQTVEDYFKQKADIDFSHALCAECLAQHYSDQSTEPDGSRDAAANE